MCGLYMYCVFCRRISSVSENRSSSDSGNALVFIAHFNLVYMADFISLVGDSGRQLDFLSHRKEGSRSTSSSRTDKP